MLAVLICFLLLFVATLVLHFAFLNRLRVTTTRWTSDSMKKWEPPPELMSKLEEDIGSATKPRTLAMIKKFLDWFNGKKESWGGVTDEQLTMLIKAHISDWPYMKQLGFSLLIDEYKALEKIRKDKEKQQKKG